MNFPDPKSVEHAILASLLDSFDPIRLSYIPSAGVFQYKENAAIYQVIHDLYSDSRKINLMTVGAAIREKKAKVDATLLIDISSNNEYIDLLSFSSLVALCYENTLRQRMADLTTDLMKSIVSPSVNPLDLIDSTKQKLDSIVEDTKPTKTSVKPIASLVHEDLGRIENLYKGIVDERVLFTPLDGFNRILGGFNPSTLNIIGARPSHGKTALLVYLADHFARMKKNVLVFSLEMGGNEIARRLITLWSKSTNNQIKNRLVDKFELVQNVHKAYVDSISVVDDYYDINSISRISREANMEKKVDAIFVDYLQLVEADGKDRNVKIGNVSRGLKMLSKQLEIPVIALSQFSRTGAQEGRKPQLFDLRDSGSIEQDADTVIMLHNYFMADPKDEAMREMMALDIKKNRAGAVGDYNCYHDVAINMFSEYPIQAF